MRSHFGWLAWRHPTCQALKGGEEQREHGGRFKAHLWESPPKADLALIPTHAERPALETRAS